MSLLTCHSFCPAQHGQVKNTPWGSSYRAAPEILHGEFGLEEIYFFFTTIKV
jgi:hypothetical protein